MKKLIIMLFAVLGIAVTTSAETIARDTVSYQGKYTFDKKIRENKKTQERTISYYVILSDLNNKKVPVSKKVYESGKITAIVYNEDSEGNRRIAKAI